MTQKIAVAVIHGIGKQGPEFAGKINAEIERHCQADCSNDIVIEPVYWARLMQEREDALWSRLIGGGPLDFQTARRMMVDFLADALAYQPTTHEREAYDDIHAEFARTLKKLAEVAGPQAPLCIIAHSLGTVIASNFILGLSLEGEFADIVEG